jgi:hypothetical protein
MQALHDKKITGLPWLSAYVENQTEKRDRLMKPEDAAKLRAPFQEMIESEFKNMANKSFAYINHAVVTDRTYRSRSCVVLATD